MPGGSQLTRSATISCTVFHARQSLTTSFDLASLPAKSSIFHRRGRIRVPFRYVAVQRSRVGILVFPLSS